MAVHGYTQGDELSAGDHPNRADAADGCTTGLDASTAKALLVCLSRPAQCSAAGGD